MSIVAISETTGSLGERRSGAVPVSASWLLIARWREAAGDEEAEVAPCATAPRGSRNSGSA